MIHLSQDARFDWKGNEWQSFPAQKKEVLFWRKLDRKHVFFPTILHDIHWLSYQIDYMLSPLGQIGMTTKSCTYRNWMFDWITIDQEQPALHLLGLIIAWLNDYLFVPRTSLIDLCIFIPLIHAHISYRFPSRGGVPIGKSIKKSSAYPGQWSQLCVHSLPPPWFLLFFSIWIVDGTIHTICSPCHIFGHHRRRSWWGIGLSGTTTFFGCNKTTDDSSPIFAACVFLLTLRSANLFSVGFCHVFSQFPWHCQSPRLLCSRLVGKPTSVLFLWASGIPIMVYWLAPDGVDGV